MKISLLNRIVFLKTDMAAWQNAGQETLAETAAVVFEDFGISNKFRSGNESWEQ